MSKFLKAARIIAALARSNRMATYLEPEDILGKIGCKKELDFYYFWIVEGGRR